MWIIVSYSRPLRTGMAGIPVLPAKAIPIPVLPIPALPGGGKKNQKSAAEGGDF